MFTGLAEVINEHEVMESFRVFTLEFAVEQHRQKGFIFPCGVPRNHGQIEKDGSIRGQVTRLDYENPIR